MATEPVQKSVVPKGLLEGSFPDEPEEFSEGSPEFSRSPELPTGSNTTIEYFDGFDDYVTGDILLYWDQINFNPPRFSTTLSNGIKIIATGGIHGPRISFSNAGVWGLYKRGRLGSIPTRTVGANVALFGHNTTTYMYTFFDGMNPQIALVVTGAMNNNKLGVRVVNPDGSVGRVILPDSTRTWTDNWFHSVEMTATFSSTDGVVIVKVDGEVWLSGTGLDTVNTGNPTCDSIAIGMGTVSASMLDYDDFYMRGDDIFCGKNTRVITRFPTANGTTNQWTRAGTDTGVNFSQVNQISPDGDVTTVKSSTLDESEEYIYPPLTLQARVHAVMSCFVSKTDFRGGVELTPLYNSGGTIYGGDPHVVDTLNRWLSVTDIQGFDPRTGAPWALADAGAVGMGVRRTS